MAYGMKLLIFCIISKFPVFSCFIIDMTFIFSSLLVCSVFPILLNVCKHFMLFRLGVDTSGREPFNVKLYA